MAKPTFSMSEELLEQINSQLEYGDNRSAWVRDAIQMKLAILDELDEIDEEMTDEERREFVIEAVNAAVEDR